ncbi:hypothetical protein DSAG12_02785 [Promethearchaeum syntrophicum]|uniref:DUF2085 domain-containing protein n=1 Tax=Promethearchaeum syntrophicum TaxID=2594042 RepID=A0A5B9DCS4_9ARCH|nr:hypothetical protein [Candidatus Prometheoarchaeum syntrophicum]QEE16954.1 hypothetical protein DSAG12_02785 [Candidatus Prometheoarchaeum syntrophicum]
MKKEKKDKIREIWADIQQGFKAVAPMLLSHHPPCERYENHTINIGKFRLCIGCFIGYPSALLTIILTKILYDHKSFNLIPILIIGIIFSLAQLLSLTSITEKKSVKIIQKFLMGTGSGFIIIFLYLTINLPEIFKLIVVFICISILIIPIGILHYRTSSRTCENCEIKEISGKCPIDYSF